MANWLTNLFDKATVRLGYTSDASFASHLRGIGTKAGASIDTETAMGLSAVYACVDRISSTIAQLHIDVMQRTDIGAVRMPSHPARPLIASRPNNHQTAFDFWETFVANVLIYGKAYAVIERDPVGRLVDLRLVDPGKMVRKEVDGIIMFEEDKVGIHFEDDVICVRNLYGVSPIELHRDLLGLAKAAQDFASEFFGSSGNMTGILSAQEPLRKEQVDVIKDSWNNSGDSLGTKLLPFGFKYERIGVRPSEAQMSEQRDFQNQEICRIFGVPPSLVGVQSNVTYSNTEQQAIQFAKYTIVPLARRIEQELDAKLLDDGSGEVFTRFDLSDLLRGDMAARAKYYDTLVKSGIMSINEARSQEHLPKTEGGEVHTVQINQIALDQLSAYSAKVAESQNSKT